MGWTGSRGLDGVPTSTPNKIFPGMEGFITMEDPLKNHTRISYMINPEDFSTSRKVMRRGRDIPVEYIKVLVPKYFPVDFDSEAIYPEGEMDNSDAIGYSDNGLGTPNKYYKSTTPFNKATALNSLRKVWADRMVKTAENPAVRQNAVIVGVETSDKESFKKNLERKFNG